MAGLDFKVDAMVNTQKKTVALFAGDVVAAHEEAVKSAKEHYATSKPEGLDIVVANTYSKSNEAQLGVPVGAGLLPKSGGHLVLMANTPEGQLTHYLLRTSGATVAGRLWHPVLPGLNSSLKQLIDYSRLVIHPQAFNNFLS